MITRAQTLAVASTYVTTLIPGRGTSRYPIGVGAARSAIRKSRPSADVHIYVTTDRDGTTFHVVHVHFRPGFWTDVEDVTDIYEIPTEALTEL
ncbi:hypothetical protein [Streptomyces gilvosporeus]|uniref:Uncharacterized protein n=1 Tax=Streptomyces gilvosporeus TaxID=553510 RepID=A0A1V0TUL2_9ACTN|nr:hypothetical protein [Streptomyces gilvosporeus]ARF56626.1 hypothetical protein B1H19_22845 [Streptomyces gilvosporeus]